NHTSFAAYRLTEDGSNSHNPIWRVNSGEDAGPSMRLPRNHIPARKSFMETSVSPNAEGINPTPKSYEGEAVRFPGSSEAPPDMETGPVSKVEVDSVPNLETEPSSNDLEPAPPLATRAERAAEGFEFPDLDDEDASTFLKETINSTPKFYDSGPVV